MRFHFLEGTLVVIGSLIRIGFANYLSSTTMTTDYSAKKPGLIGTTDSLKAIDLYFVDLKVSCPVLRENSGTFS